MCSLSTTPSSHRTCGRGSSTSLSTGGSCTRGSATTTVVADPLAVADPALSRNGPPLSLPPPPPPPPAGAAPPLPSGDVDGGPSFGSIVALLVALAAVATRQ